MEVVAGYLESYPDDAAGNLYRLTMPAFIANQARHEAALWQLLSRHPKYIPAARYFAVYSYRGAQYDDLQTILSRYSADPTGKSWRHYLEGCFSAASGDLKAARDHFLASLAEEERWETHYNIALVTSPYRDYTGTLDHFQNADRLLVDSAGTAAAPYRSLIRAGIARLMAEQGNPQGAIRELLYALELDPDNYEARLMLKKLKGR
jgi:tetratricopeptide (TPR) repeat protein